MLARVDLEFCGKVQGLKQSETTCGWERGIRRWMTLDRGKGRKLMDILRYPHMTDFKLGYRFVDSGDEGSGCSCGNPCRGK